MTYYIGGVVEDMDGNMCVELPVDMLWQMGWDENSLLEWVIEEEEVYIREKEDAVDS